MTTHHDSTRWGIPVVYSPETPKLVADELSDEGQCFGVPVMLEESGQWRIFQLTSVAQETHLAKRPVLHP